MTGNLARRVWPRLLPRPSPWMASRRAVGANFATGRDLRFGTVRNEHSTPAVSSLRPRFDNMRHDDRTGAARNVRARRAQWSAGLVQVANPSWPPLSLVAECFRLHHTSQEQSSTVPCSNRRGQQANGAAHERDGRKTRRASVLAALKKFDGRGLVYRVVLVYRLRTAAPRYTRMRRGRRPQLWRSTSTSIGSRALRAGGTRALILLRHASCRRWQSPRFRPARLWAGILPKNKRGRAPGPPRVRPRRRRRSTGG
jgi:hypothetical protein